MSRLIIVLLSLCYLLVYAQVPPTYTPDMISDMQEDVFKKVYLTPQCIVWQSNDSLFQIGGVLLEKGNSQRVSEHLPGVKIVEAGGNKIHIYPNLEDLEGGRELFQHLTAYYALSMSNKGMTIKSRIKAPKGVKIAKS
jgi:hypothetical protein